MTELTQTRPALVCAECGATSEDGIRWRAYLTAEDRQDGESFHEEVEVSCQVCAEREFDGP